MRLHNIYDRIKDFDPSIVNVYAGYSNDHFLSSGILTMENFHPTARPWYVKAQENNHVFVSDPYVNIRNEIVVCISKRSSDSSFVTALDFRLNNFTAVYKNVDPTKTKIYLVNKNTKTILSSNIKNYIGLPIMPPHTHELKEFVVDNKNHQKYHVVKSDIPNTPWKLYTFSLK